MLLNRDKILTNDVTNIPWLHGDENLQPRFSYIIFEQCENNNLILSHLLYILKHYSFYVFVMWMGNHLLINK